MDRLQSFGNVRAIDAESRSVEVIASTGDVARDGMVIDARGWQVDNYTANPVVLWAHDDTSLPIAKATRTRRDGKDLIQTHVFAEHQRAQEVFDLVRGGFVNAVSVRWAPLETERRKINGVETLVFVRQELLEVSYVPVPADPGALVKRADGAPFDMADFSPPADEPETLTPTADTRLAALAERLTRASTTLAR